MKNKLFFIAILFSLGVAFFSSCEKDSGSEEPAPESITERQKVINDYKTNYLGSVLNDPGWIGDVASCDPGTVSAEAHNKTLQRIKYFRRLVGLPDNITFDATKNAKCQKAALMFKANNSLSHTPPQSWLCWSQDGYNAASSSNIGWSSTSGAGGSHSSLAVSRFIEDAGSNNLRVGHRRWLLYSKAKVMGHGSTTNTNAIWVIGDFLDSIPASVPEFTAYPPKGYIPAPLVYPRWSFSVPGGDFTGSGVSMTDANNNPITCNITSKAENGVGDNSIVWEPQGINTTSPTDISYNVNITNVSGKNYSYAVTIIQPE